MKINRIVLIALLLVSAAGFSQNVITKNLGDFHELRTYRGLDVELKHASHPKVEIMGDKSHSVVIKNINGVLKISMTLEETFSAEDVNVVLYFSEDIDEIVVNEGSKIHSKETIKQEKIRLRAEEAGEIRLTLKVNYLDAKAITAGVINAYGKAINQNIVVNTGGIYHGFDLDSEYANVSAYTGGTASVTASRVVDATAKLGASVVIHGNPKEIKKNESLGGYIKD